MYSPKMFVLGVFVTLLWFCCFSHGKHGRKSQRNEFLESRIVNGREMRQNQYPFQIGIERQGLGIICGGSLISKSHILTASHCFYGSKWTLLPSSKFTIRGGEHSFAKNEGTEQFRKIKNLKTHPNFNPSGSNDIAIIEVDPFELTKAVQIIPMALPGSEYNQTSCTVSGWGYLHALKPDNDDIKAGGYPDKPRYVNVDIIEKEHCQNLLKEYDQVIDENTICAGVLAGGKDACSADSGGPLVCEGIDGKPMLVGIVGAGLGCAQKDIPGLYTDVAKMETWIMQTLDELQ